MIEKRDENKPIKFLLTLSSYSDGKRREECIDILKSLYPYKIDKNDLLIKRTDEKNKYEVFINGGKSKRKKYLFGNVFVILCIVGIIAGGFVLHAKIKDERKADIQKQKEIENENQEKIRQQKEAERELKELKNEYELLIKESYEKVYPRLGYIYSCITKDAVIENLLIERNHFSLDVRTFDSLKILSRFEESRMFLNVKMLRAFSEDKKENVTLSGDFRIMNHILCEEDEIQNQIVFYQNELEKYRERKEVNERRNLSTYMDYIKRLLEDCECELEYVQVKGEKDRAEIECFVHSSSRGILEFLKKIQNDDRNGEYDIKQFNFRNSSDTENVQTKLLFDFQKSVSDEDLEEILGEGETFIDITDLERIFKKKETVVVKTKPDPVKPVMESKPKLKQEAVIEPKPIEVKKIIPEKLTYVGLTKKNGLTVILAKGGINEKVYKFVMTEEESEGDFCIQTSNGYYARQDSKYYEVGR